MDDKKPKGRTSRIIEAMRARNPGFMASVPGPSSQVSEPSAAEGQPAVSSGVKVEEAPPPPPKSSGRGQFLAKILERIKEKEAEEKKATVAKSTSEPLHKKLEPPIREPEQPQKEGEPPKRGRGELIAKYTRLNEKLGEVTSESPLREMIQRSAYIPFSSSVQEKLAELDIEEDAPVIKKGEGGDHIEVTTNYITLTTDPEKGVFEFQLQFEPEIDFVAFRYKLVHKHFHTRRGIRCYDGGNLLFMPEKITSDKLVIAANHPQDDSPVNIIVTYKRQMKLRECGQLYNILFNNCAKVLHLARLGREYFDYRIGHQIPQYKLEVWPGYVTSVQEFEGGIHLCCDIKHRVLRTETAYDVLANIARYSADDFKSLSLKEMIGQCILTRYNNNLYRVDDIDWSKTPMSTFKTVNNGEVTFCEYYKKQYNLDIVDLNQPLLLNKPKSKKPEDVGKMIYLVPELCHMTGLTDKMRKDFKVMKEIAIYTRVTPLQRQLCIKKFIENIKASPQAQDMLKDWGLQIAEDPVRLDARVLPSESIFFKNKTRILKPPKSEWSKQIWTNGVFRSVELREWLFIYTSRNTNLAVSFCEMLRSVAPGLGLEIFDPIMIPLKDDRIDTYISASKDNMNPNVQLILYLCPTARDDRYSAIKRLCCKDMPVISQIVNCGTIAKENRIRAVVQNVALQINNKLGGASWSLHVPLKNSMICGIDSYHDSEKKGWSVGAFVASIDQQYTKWFSQTCVQDPKQELVDGLISCFGLALKHYRACNDSYPDRIVIFRDGVGDGQLSFVKNYEIKQFIQAYHLVPDNYAPKFTFVVVQKRINTKFYTLTDPLGNKLENPDSGSVLDHTITRRNFYDFFLVSQHVSCGTATPTHYIVLYDDSDLKPEHMQRLTYKFCHLYYNWPGTIKVPAPCQYAHKLAFLVGQHIKGAPDRILENKLYYL